MKAHDLFAGPGGWDIAARSLGIDSVGVEIDPNACATRQAARLTTVRGSVTDFAPHILGPAEGLLAGPPCPPFSAAGSGHGRAQMSDILLGVKAVTAGMPIPQFYDEITPLVLEPLRYVRERFEKGDPYSWLAFEQVPAVLPIWQAMASVFRTMGYGVETGILRAEQFGVPQVRKRAVLVAKMGAEARLPEPTHSKYYQTDPSRLDSGVLSWRSMASAVGWGFTHRPSQTVVSQSAGGPRLLDGGSGAWQGVLRAVERGQWIRRPDRAHLLLNRGEVSTCSTRDGSILQTFPADYPWHGTPTLQAKQIGNAVPPMLARAILSALTR